jgi:RsiW-degrading membrane proteinase PrsW (M82 family)
MSWREHFTKHPLPDVVAVLLFGSFFAGLCLHFIRSQAEAETLPPPSSALPTFCGDHPEKFEDC